MSLRRALLGSTLALALCATGCGAGQGGRPPAELPDLTLKNLSGRDVAISGFRGKILLVDFWATWCEPCGESIPELIKLQARYGDRGLQVLGIALDVGGAEVVGPYVSELGMNYPVLLGDETTTQAFGGILGVPTSFVIDRRGRIIKRFVGIVDHRSYEKFIRPLL